MASTSNNYKPCCSEGTCNICFDSITHFKDKYTCKICNYQTHIECIVNWFNSAKKETCPGCRTEFTETVYFTGIDLSYSYKLHLPFTIDGQSFSQFHKKVTKLTNQNERCTYLQHVIRTDNDRLNQYLRWTNTFLYIKQDKENNELLPYIARFTPFQSYDNFKVNGVEQKIYYEKQFQSQERYKVREIWTKNGKLHRSDDQPALIYYYKVGTVYKQTWYKNDKYYRNNPSDPVTIVYDEMGQVISKEWKNKQGLFDTTRPGLITYYDNASQEIYYNESGNIIKIRHVNNMGQLNVWADGPALTIFDKDDIIFSYYENGVLINSYITKKNDKYEIISHSLMKARSQGLKISHVDDSITIIKKRKRKC